MPSLLQRNDILAILPAGFEKSLIFQLFVIVAEMETALVVLPL